MSKENKTVIIPFIRNEESCITRVTTTHTTSVDKIVKTFITFLTR